MKSLIIIPTYNEKENLENLVEQILSLRMNAQILIIDDNSPDGTGRIADELSQKHKKIQVIHRHGKMGLGTAYIEGFKYALKTDADCIFEMDADFSHKPQYLPFLLEKIKEFDLVLGSRYVKGGGTKNWSFGRRLLSRGGNLYTRTILGINVKDLTGGFKCFRRKVLKEINLDKIRSDGYGFQIEMTYRVYQKGFKIAEIPIVFTERRAGKSKMSKRVVREALLMVWRLRLGC